MILGKIEIDGLKKNEGGRGGIWAASGQLCALHPQFFAQIIMAILHFNLTWQINSTKIEIVNNDDFQIPLWSQIFESHPRNFTWVLVKLS